jgi:hypothetical protein
MSHFRNTSKNNINKRDWLVQDDITGAIIKASESAFNLKGQLVRRSEMDEADSDDLPPIVPRVEAQPPFVRPAGPDRFVSTAPAEKDTIAERFADGNYNLDT